MRRQTILPALAMSLASPGAYGADLVVWWEKGFYEQEDEAVAEIIAAFEEETGKEVEAAFHPQADFTRDVVAALETGESPDFAFGLDVIQYIEEWALNDRLVDLTEAIGPFASLFDPDALERAMLPAGGTEQRALYGLPMGRSTNHIHVWKSLLERAGFTLDDIPREWEAFWSFWCDQVQPAVRQAAGRDDIWGVGLTMSAAAYDTYFEFLQFVAAYDADYVNRDGELVIDHPEIRQRLIQAIDNYAAIFRRGCSPPGSVTWGDIDNNKQFHAQTVVATLNPTLSIPNALKRERPDDYYENTRTIEWPLGPSGEPFPILGEIYVAAVFKDGGHTATAKEFVRFLVGEGWLGHYLNFSAERILPPMSALSDQPFWLDPSDPHRMAAAMHLVSRPLARDYAVASGNWRHYRVYPERVWGDAVYRIVAEGISAEQAVDEAIARIKEILAE